MRSTVNPDGHPCLVQIIGVTVLHRHLLVMFMRFSPLPRLCLESWIVSKGWQQTWDGEVGIEIRRNGGAMFRTSNEQFRFYCLKGMGLHIWLQAHSYFHQSCRTKLNGCWEIKLKFVGILRSRITLSISLNTQ